ncbi:hypothetical protein AAP_03896 [Ascosphaera apis ARSEF 7405]|uniref:Uncharacterized protein n=1 Tax=Ascosphaera apis ARSEF 7405 TaxID=392613 RepID=A0A167XR39_9EURO|nr:hypothetical protein AAP_03896 [Ascosphaera apis ARSEF 7405]
MPSPNPLSSTVSPHILSLLSSLHKKSLEQEKALTSSSNDDSHKFTSPAALSALKRRFANDLSSEAYQTAFDALMLDKFIALDEDKYVHMNQSIGI